MLAAGLLCPQVVDECGFDGVSLPVWVEHTSAVIPGFG